MSKKSELELNIKALKADAYDVIAKIQELNNQYQGLSQQLNQQLDGINKQIASNDQQLQAVAAEAPVTEEKQLLTEQK